MKRYRSVLYKQVSIFILQVEEFMNAPHLVSYLNKFTIHKFCSQKIHLFLLLLSQIALI